MDYRETMDVLSQCGLGAVLIDGDDRILKAGRAAVSLLHQGKSVEGRSLREIAPALCVETEMPLYENVAFGEYLTRCPSPETELPPGTRLVVFRSAINDVCHDMLISLVNRLSESVALFDSRGRTYLLNDATVRMEHVAPRDVVGKNVSDIYSMAEGEELAIPRVLRTKRPILNNRQHYFTPQGREVDVVSSAFPIAQNGQILGAFTVMEDCSGIGELHRQIIELQEKLLSRQPGGHGGGQYFKGQVSF